MSPAQTGTDRGTETEREGGGGAGRWVISSAVPWRRRCVRACVHVLTQMPKDHAVRLVKLAPRGTREGCSGRWPALTHSHGHAESLAPPVIRDVRWTQQKCIWIPLRWYQWQCVESDLSVSTRKFPFELFFFFSSPKSEITADVSMNGTRLSCVWMNTSFEGGLLNKIKLDVI